MKHKLLILVAAVFSTGYLNAQILNSGFESWTNSEPNSWVTTNGLMILGNPQSVFKTTNAHTDSFACEINSVKVTNKPPSVFVPDYVGSVFIGKQIGLQSLRGIPYTNKPAKFEFWYTYQTTAGDTANAVVLLTKYNTSLSKTDTIAFGYFFNSSNVATYTKAEVDLTYLGTGAPDTAVIIFSSIMLSSQNAGSKLIIDDLAFTGGNVGVAEQKTTIDFTLFPNPSTGVIYLNFNTNQEEITTSIFDLQGKEVLNNKYNNQAEIEILTNPLKAGIYFIKVSNGTITTVRKLIVE